MITLMMLSMLRQRLELFLKIDALLILLRASYACTAFLLAPIGELGKGAFPTNSHTVVATDLDKTIDLPNNGYHGTNYLLAQIRIMGRQHV